MASSSLPACSGVKAQTPAAISSIATGMTRNAAANDPVCCCNAMDTNGHITKPTSQAIDQENPLPTPRMRVG